MSFALPELYPITDVRVSGLSHAEQVESLIAGGATLIQLREKHADPRELFLDAEAALRIARAHGVLAAGADSVACISELLASP